MWSMTPTTPNPFSGRVRQTGSDAARVYRNLARQPSWAVRLFVILAAILALAGALVLIIPLIVLIGIIALFLAVRRRVLLWSAKLFGSRDGEGRKNVRVIERR